MVIMKEEVEAQLRTALSTLDSLIEKFEFYQTLTLTGSPHCCQFGCIADRLRTDRGFLEDTLKRSDWLFTAFEDTDPDVYWDKVEGIKYVRRGGIWYEQ